MVTVSPSEHRPVGIHGPEDSAPWSVPIPSVVNQVVYLIERVGVTIVVCAFLAYMLHVKLEKLGCKIDRCIRNERAIMQHLQIPIIVKDDEWEK